MKNLTSRERVKIALDHMEPDRLPCDMTITIKPYMDLCKYLGIKEEPYWDSWAHAFPSPEVLEKLKIDVCHVYEDIGYKGHTPFDISMNEFIDEWGIKKIKVDDENGGFLFQMVTHPLKDAETVDEINEYPWPEIDEDSLDKMETRVRELYNETDLALTATFGGNVWERSHYLRSMENFMIDMVINPEMAEAILNNVLKVQMKVDEAVFKRIGKYLTYMRFQGEDLGHQTAPFMSLDLFREVIKSKLESEWKNAKKHFTKYNPDGKISIHSCGAIYDFIPDFIEMGADILNPLQPNAAGMDTEKIKKIFGDKLSFHGGVDSQGAIAQGTIEDIRREVKLRIGHLAPGGGYILAPSHNIQAGVSPEKIIALYDAVYEYGKYPISI